MYPQINLKISCNNQICLTVGNYRKISKSPHQNIIHLHDRVKSSAIDALKQDIRYQRERYEQMAKIHKKVEKRPLDLISKFQRDKKAPSSRLNTPKSFTRFSGQRLREAGAAMDIASGGNPRFCHEVTLTLPANHQSAFRALASQSGYVVNRLTQLIRRNHGESVLWFFVWEYQKRGALHLHMALYHPDESEGMWLCTRLIELWHKILCDLCERCDTDMFLARHGDRSTIRANHQHHTQPLQKGVGSYFAKYAGKSESKNDWYCKAYPISRFWGSSQSIKNIVKANCIEVAWDYFSNLHEQEKKMTEIIETILSKLNIVSSSSYDFNVSLKGKARLNRYSGDRKILVLEDDKCIASGTRYTFYCESGDLQTAIKAVSNMKDYF